MPDKEDALALPGFEGLVLPDTDRAGSQDFTGQQYTATLVRRDYPQTFQSVVRALFYYKLPVRTCADLFRMNGKCVAAIRDMVIAEGATNPAAAFLINSRQRSQRDIVLTRLVEAIAERLDDEEAVAKMDINELTSILARLESAKPARNGTDAPPPASKSEDKDVIDVDAFDAAINGLDREKKSAREVGVEVGAEDVPGASGTPSECSTRSENQGICSL